MLAVASAPLPLAFWLVKVPLLILMAMESWRHQHRLAHRQGSLQRHADECWQWQGARWRLTGPMRWLPGAVLITWRNEQGKILKLWLMEDMMTRAEWRQLRACCLSVSPQ